MGTRADLAPAGKRLIATGMVKRGKSFIEAAIMLRQQGGDPYVVRYLHCQGIEVVLKGALLLQSFDAYEPQFGVLGHDLEKLVDEYFRCLNRTRGLTNATKQQLCHLNSWYCGNHLLDGNAIEYSRVMRCLNLVLRTLVSVN